MAKLIIDGSIKRRDAQALATMLRKDLYEWIKDNTISSENSAINYLVELGIEQIASKLEYGSILITLNTGEDK